MQDIDLIPFLLLFNTFLSFPALYYPFPSFRGYGWKHGFIYIDRQTDGSNIRCTEDKNGQTRRQTDRKTDKHIFYYIRYNPVILFFVQGYLPLHVFVSLPITLLSLAGQVFIIQVNIEGAIKKTLYRKTWGNPSIKQLSDWSLKNLIFSMISASVQYFFVI